jgi:hypothetical protein
VHAPASAPLGGVLQRAAVRWGLLLQWLNNRTWMVTYGQCEERMDLMLHCELPEHGSLPRPVAQVDAWRMHFAATFGGGHRNWLIARKKCASQDHDSTEMR